MESAIHRVDSLGLALDAKTGFSVQSWKRDVFALYVEKKR